MQTDITQGITYTVNVRRPGGRLEPVFTTPNRRAAAQLRRDYSDAFHAGTVITTNKIQKPA